MNLRLLRPLVFGSLLLAVLPCRGATPPPDLPAPQTTVIFGQKIVYYDLGSGPTVVLLHGMGSSAKGDWGRCMLALAEHHRVIAPDQLGFGGSDKPFIDYGIQTWVDFLGEFLRQRKPGTFILAGESLGGWIAAQYTIQALGELQ
ncbi:MAG TPA: alpha/beta fold hydrolase, partial [Opitutaceae bacterium]